MFLYDCCSGNGQKEEKEDEENDDDGNKGIKYSDLSKQIDDGNCDNSWGQDDHNPDYRLAVIQAGNHGFDTKLEKGVGSYLIQSFYEKTMDVLNNNKKDFISEIFGEIQDDLH